MLFPLNFFTSLLFLLIISISHQNVYDEPTLTTNISGGFATLVKKTDEMMNAASEHCQRISTNVGQSVITFGQSVIGQNAIENLDDINLLKPLIVEHFCNETIELPKNDQFYQFHKELCAQLKEEDKSIEEALKNMQKTVETTFNAIDQAKIDELIKEIQNSDSLSAVNKNLFVSLLGQCKAAIDKLVPIINGICQCFFSCQFYHCHLVLVAFVAGDGLQNLTRFHSCLVMATFAYLKKRKRVGQSATEAEKETKKEIPICGDVWLAVFALLSPRKLGFKIALLSHRFDYFVDEHFKTRKWTFDTMRFEWRNGQNGKKEMRICSMKDQYHTPYAMETVYFYPIRNAQVPLPNKVIGFKSIYINYIDQNVIAFLHHFRPLFTLCGGINLDIHTNNEHFLAIVLRVIWPILNQNIYGIKLGAGAFGHLRRIAPSILSDLPLLRSVIIPSTDAFPAFPLDQSAAASAGQAMTKWLLAPRSDGVPKMLRCKFDSWDWPSTIGQFKEAFINASSGVNFIIVIWFERLLLPASDYDEDEEDYDNNNNEDNDDNDDNNDDNGDDRNVVPFQLNNHLTGERLTLKQYDEQSEYKDHFLLIRCPILRDESKWTKWEREAIGWEYLHQWNKIIINVYTCGIGDGFLDETSAGPSGQQQQAEGN